MCNHGTNVYEPFNVKGVSSYHNVRSEVRKVDLSQSFFQFFGSHVYTRWHETKHDERSETLSEWMLMSWRFETFFIRTHNCWKRTKGINRRFGTKGPGILEPSITNVVMVEVMVESVTNLILKFPSWLFKFYFLVKGV